MNPCDYPTLDVYEFYLLSYYREIGICYEDAETTAACLNMSRPQVARKRLSLMDKGYITITPMTPRELYALGWLGEPGSDTNQVYVVTVLSAGVSNRDSAQSGVSVVDAKRETAGVETGGVSVVDAPNDPETDDASLGVSNRDKELKSLGVTSLIESSSGAGAREAPAAIHDILQHPYWQAFIRGRGGIDPGLDTRDVADIQDAIGKLQAGRVTADEVEGCTREQVADASRKTPYKFQYLPEHLPGYRAKHTPPPRSDFWGQKIEPEPPVDLGTPEERAEVLRNSRAMFQAAQQRAARDMAARRKLAAS